MVRRHLSAAKRNLESCIEYLPRLRQWKTFSPTTKPAEMLLFYSGANKSGSFAVRLTQWFSPKKEVKEVNNEMVQSLATKLVAEITAQVLASTQVRARTSGERVEARLLTVKEAAQYLARSEQAIRHLVFQRDLPVVRSGRNVRLDRRDLDRWIENSRS